MPERTKPTLLPCPFCGGDAHISGLGYCGPADCYDVSVICDGCDARTAALVIDQNLPDVKEVEAAVAAEAAVSWNRRAETTVDEAFLRLCETLGIQASPLAYLEVPAILRAAESQGNERFRAALMRVADPDDDCHCGASGPWQDVAQHALGFTVTDGGDWYDADGRKLSVPEMIARFPRSLTNEH